MRNRSSNGPILLKYLKAPSRSLESIKTNKSSVSPQMSFESWEPSSQNHKRRPSNRRITHKVTEKRYRDNLNNEIEMLEAVLPWSSGNVFGRSIKGNARHPTTRCSGITKSVVISTAAQHLIALRNTHRKLEAANKEERSKLDELLALIKKEEGSKLPKDAPEDTSRSYEAEVSNVQSGLRGSP